MDEDTTPVAPGPFNVQHQGTDLSKQVQDMSKGPVAWGGSSLIYKAVVDSKPVAVKMILGAADDEKAKRVSLFLLTICWQNDQRSEKKFKRECIFWSQLIHINIATCLGFAEGLRMGPFGAIISSWYKNGDAESYLAKNGATLDSSARMKLWTGVVSGVCFLHEYCPPIVHGDLKPKNVLIDSDGCPKLCDFGLATLVVDVVGTGLTATMGYIGTARYTAPDLLHETATLPTMATDVWALGCVGLEFIYSVLPYSHQINNTWDCIIEDIKKGQAPAQREAISRLNEHLWNLFESCWAQVPSSRPSCRDLKTMALTIEFKPEPMADAEVHSVFKLARGYQSQARDAEAAVLLAKVVDWRRARLGEEHKDTIYAIDCLAQSYDMLGRYAEAADLWSKCWDGGGQSWAVITQTPSM